jgi:outer membrane protein TolC
MTGFDELLEARVTQLRVIEDHLDRVERMLRVGSVEMARVKLQQLRADVLLAIQQAEREHAEF